MEREIIERTKLYLSLFEYLSRINKEIFFQEKVSLFLDSDKEQALLPQVEMSYDTQIEFLNRIISFIDHLVVLADSIQEHLNREEFGQACLQLQEFISVFEENKAKESNLLTSLREAELYLRKFLPCPAQA